MSTQRSVRRNLLAMCTFLVPLGILAWIGSRELQRQAEQVRTAVDREAIQFLQAATQAIDQRLDELLPAVERECDALLAHDSPAATVRELRAHGFGSVLDVVLISNDGRLRYPDAGSQRLALPFHRDAFLRSGDDERGRDALRRADLLITLEKFDEAEATLLAASKQAAASRDGPDDNPIRDRDRAGRRGPGESTWSQVTLGFRLATVQKKLGKHEQAEASFQRVVDLTAGFRSLTRNGRSFDPMLDSEQTTLGLLSELALAEADEDGALRCNLLAAIANGDRDLSSEAILTSVADRLAAGAPTAVRARADELREEVRLHLHARTFAADYDRVLRETVLRRIRAVESASENGDLRPILTSGSPSTLLLLHRAPEVMRARAEWLGIRLDAGRLLAGALEPFLRGDSSFRLAIADSEDLPIVAAPKAPEDYAPPAIAAHGMVLRAYPADVDSYLKDAADRRTNALLLVGFLFLAASIGAVWMWRSVSREAELLGLKVDLLSRVSHELKTPLALISLYGETLQLKRARDADQAAQFGGVITREAGRLTTMIQRILDFSRREAGTLVYAPEVTDLGEVLEAVADTYAPHLEAKGASLSTDLPVGIWARVDRSALESVVLNLLENAAKYASDEDPSAEICIELRRNGDCAEIDVKDRGRGIPDGERSVIFDSFYRASNAGEVRGAGLGLSLVRHFAQAHGGTVVAMAREGGGSIFRITVPTTPATA